MSKKIVLEVSKEDAQLLNQALLFYTGNHILTILEQSQCSRLCHEILKAEDENRSVIEWEHPRTNIPCDEGETVLVRLKSGEYKTDVVCSDVCFGEDDCEHMAYWLDSTQDWDWVDAWAHLPEGGEE